MKVSRYLVGPFLVLILAISFISFSYWDKQKSPVDYVNPYIGNISHLLVPTYPTVHLPNSMLRFIPNRESYTSDIMHGLPLVTTSHRGSSSFKINPLAKLTDRICLQGYTYDNEQVTPYRYSVFLEGENVCFDYAPSHQSAVCRLSFEKKESNIVITAENGELAFVDGTVQGYETLRDGITKVYLYLETKKTPVKTGILQHNEVNFSRNKSAGNDASLVLCFDDSDIDIRYGISFISKEQAKRNLKREINTYKVDDVAQQGCDKWNEALGKFVIKGSDEDAKTVFYTSLYRFYERPINISEDGKYYSGSDKKVHNDEGIDFYTDDWVWDTYRAAHPLRIIIDPKKQTDIIQSFVRMAKQTPEGWMPTFPEVTGDSHRMNGNHVVSVIADAHAKRIDNFDVMDAYNACRGAIREKSHLPWLRIPNTELDSFFHEHGYFPGLNVGELEYVTEVDSWERRQSVAVSLGAYYDYWCLARLAKELNNSNDYRDFLKFSFNYCSLFNKETAFFHPRNIEGDFIESVDYKFSGGLGARDYYDENNAWIYRWMLPHNVVDLISLMGGEENFVEHLEQTFREPLGRSKYEFYAQLPDHTGNVGQFSMGNEPSLHIPYLYNYAKQPWKTQKRIRTLLDQWFRDDLMGVPGDEDGGGLSAFVVFSSLGFYPVTPGLPMYVIGSPVFEKATIQLPEGKTFTIQCANYAPENKYIQSAKLNGKTWDKSWFSHQDVMSGGILEFEMGKYPNKMWANTDASIPPSFEMKD